MNLGKENETTEFKETTSEKNEACDSIVAILNKKGQGTLYFGVKNNGEIKGQKIGLDTERTLSETIFQNIEPRIFPTIETYLFKDDRLIDINSLDQNQRMEFNDKSYEGVIKISFSGNQIPYSSRGRFYKRVSDQDKKATTTELRKMLISGGFDPTIEVKAKEQHLTFNSLKRELSLRSVDYKNDAVMEKNLSFFTDENRFNLLSLLLSDQCPFSMKVVQFKGLDKTSIPQTNELGRKSLIDSTIHVLDFCKNVNETRTESVGMKRETVFLFDDVAFREAWLNAVVHTNWLELVPPAVYFFNDRVEIVSHGGLPYGLSEEAFFSDTSKPVNHVLFDIFNKIGLGDQTGHGVSKIVSKYGREAFDITEKFITVTLKFSFIPLFAFAYSATKKLSTIQSKVFSTVLTNPYLSMNEIAQVAQVNYNSVIKAMQKLQEMNLVKRSGSRKTGFWEVIRPEA